MIPSQIATEGLVEEGFLQFVEGVQLVLVEGFEPLVHAEKKGSRGGAGIAERVEQRNPF